MTMMTMMTHDDNDDTQWPQRIETVPHPPAAVCAAPGLPQVWPSAQQSGKHTWPGGW